MNPSPHLLHCTYLHADVETRIFTSLSTFIQVSFIGRNRTDTLISFALFVWFCHLFAFFPHPIQHTCAFTEHRKFSAFCRRKYVLIFCSAPPQNASPLSLYFYGIKRCSLYLLVGNKYYLFLHLFLYSTILEEEL